MTKTDKPTVELDTYVRYRCVGGDVELYGDPYEAEMIRMEIGGYDGSLVKALSIREARQMVDSLVALIDAAEERIHQAAADLPVTIL